jgi:hypothetical protein
VSGEKVPRPYRKAAPIAGFFKALAQMAIGLAAVVVLLVRLIMAWVAGSDVNQLQAEIFGVIGVALALAAAVELAYTLYTHGPDEALNPVMLALSAALILQLGHVELFQWPEGVAALLYVSALAGLFAVRNYLSKEQDPEDWSFFENTRNGLRMRRWWRKRFPLPGTSEESEAPQSPGPREVEPERGSAEDGASPP